MDGDVSGSVTTQGTTPRISARVPTLNVSETVKKDTPSTQMKVQPRAQSSQGKRFYKVTTNKVFSAHIPFSTCNLKKLTPNAKPQIPTTNFFPRRKIVAKKPPRQKWSIVFAGPI